MQPLSVSFLLPSPKATHQAAQNLGSLLQKGDTIGLDGPLGVGKTHFVKGLAQGLQVPPHIPITSPSFAIIQEYQGRIPLYHVDLYRLEHLDEIAELGLWEAERQGVWVIEWLSRFPPIIPQNRLHITLFFDQKKTARVLQAEAFGESMQTRLASWQKLQNSVSSY